MSGVTLQVALDRKPDHWMRWAFLLALLFHLLLFLSFSWFRIPRLDIPAHHTQPQGPFMLKSIEIRPDALTPQTNPLAQLPTAEPPKNPSQFNLDPRLVEKALQTPQPTLTAPKMPDAAKIVAAADLSQGLPFAQSPQAKIVAPIADITPQNNGPLTPANLADHLLSASGGADQPGLPGGAPSPGTDTSNLPGFSQLAPGFHVSAPTLSDLPEPVLLRLPSDVLFDFNSATLKPDAGTLLAQAATLITKYPQANIQIDGYSDSFGDPDYNVTLSQKRAEAVMAWLQAHMVAPGYNFRAAGHGKANPVVSPTGTIEEQQRNRRVELLIQALKPVK